ncbi:hypothetical protein [Streptomyces sp. NPDC050388]|uniref:hypothetical protein n=1 Tax=Streptomyces sp. NPDC050388 TaxID=3155781 RepID=UPI0034395B66
MSEAKRYSVMFAFLGCVNFLTGIVVWAMLDRFNAMAPFACSAVLFAGAWLWERFPGARRDHRCQDPEAAPDGGVKGTGGRVR